MILFKLVWTRHVHGIDDYEKLDPFEVVYSKRWIELTDDLVIVLKTLICSGINIRIDPLKRN